jgi:hypothetical protein
MAKIVEDHVVISISRIAKEGDKLPKVVTKEVAETLEQVAQELVGDGAVVEVVNKE